MIKQTAAIQTHMSDSFHIAAETVNVGEKYKTACRTTITRSDAEFFVAIPAGERTLRRMFTFRGQFLATGDAAIVPAAYASRLDLWRPGFLMRSLIAHIVSRL
jgi:hypothetical protein